MKELAKNQWLFKRLFDKVLILWEPRLFENLRTTVLNWKNHHDNREGVWCQFQYPPSSNISPTPSYSIYIWVDLSLFSLEYVGQTAYMETRPNLALTILSNDHVSSSDTLATNYNKNNRKELPCPMNYAYLVIIREIVFLYSLLASSMQVFMDSLHGVWLHLHPTTSLPSLQHSWYTYYFKLHYAITSYSWVFY
jgi:hypothetical protein